MSETVGSVFLRTLATVTGREGYRAFAAVLLGFPLCVAYWSVLYSGGPRVFGSLSLLVGVPVAAAVLLYLLHAVAALDRLTAKMGGTGTVSAAVLLLVAAMGLVVLVAGGTLSAVLVLAPFLYKHPDIVIEVGFIRIDTFAEATALSPLGFLVAVGTLQLEDVATDTIAASADVALEGTDGD